MQDRDEELDKLSNEISVLRHHEWLQQTQLAKLQAGISQLELMESQLSKVNEEAAKLKQTNKENTVECEQNRRRANHYRLAIEVSKILAHPTFNLLIISVAGKGASSSKRKLQRC